ncbi:exonuclease domain-containing protein [Ornithinimicrobium sufpigmenti]|uniref:exonuclease domain-containing protein n=1 Tax=Ornithinimicrobium sufpigmenti TaxID=2508882 RepID=UPI0010356206|nr:MULTISPECIES: exonuclease domain-containing protein [unclassified Ornithinimicrobium]
MSWHTGRLALFDLETTGVDCHRDRIVTAAVILAGGGIGTDTANWIVDPGIPIPDAAAEIHGITTEHAREHGGDPAVAVADLAQRLLEATSCGYPVVGHNVVYDLTMLSAECIRHGHHGLAGQLRAIEPVVDTFVLDKWVDTYRKGSRKLVDVARHYGVALSEQDAHGAAADALAAGRVAWCIAQKYPGVRIPLDELHALQAEQKRAQAESFGRYLVRQGKTDDVSREWPVQSPPAGWSPEQLPAPREEAAA